MYLCGRDKFVNLLNHKHLKHGNSFVAAVHFLIFLVYQVIKKNNKDLAMAFFNISEVLPGLEVMVPPSSGGRPYFSKGGPWVGTSEPPGTGP